MLGVEQTECAKGSESPLCSRAGLLPCAVYSTIGSKTIISCSLVHVVRYGRCSLGRSGNE
jgi:hypothetical protein